MRHTNRKFSAVSAATAIVLAGFLIGPMAFADTPPPDWQPTSSTTTGDNVTVTWETATSTYSLFDSTEFLDPTPSFRPNIINGSTETKYFAFGTDFVTQGAVDPIWLAEGWGALSEVVDGSGITDSFWMELPAGASAAGSSGSASMWNSGMPSWSGHTITVYELDAAPIDGVVPIATALASIVTPGGFVSANLADFDMDQFSAVLGKRLNVSSGGQAPEVFGGLATSVTASGLTPGLQVELWMMNFQSSDTNYAYFQLLGGALPVGALHVGNGTVATDGTLHAYVVIPADTAHENGGTTYQMVAGVRAERYWPAGTWDDFIVKEPPNSSEIVTSGNSATSVELGATSLSLQFDDPDAAGTTAVTVSSTGPEASGFQLAVDPPVYYHLSSTVAEGTPATVCITYDQGLILGDPPHLFHFDTDTLAWVDITTTAIAGEVCGVTTNFSPFTLGYSEQTEFNFTGFFEPVSMNEINLAKAGQAIPVKFSLAGDQGMDVVVSAVFRATGAVANPSGDPIETTAVSRSGLKYDPSTDQYTYVWKTEKSMAKKTGQFVLTLSDGTVHTFDVNFRK